jgi:class I fructose-bisphosphate aldolase/fructose-bisphosphate aldolase/2-amino-3,7-dideoxy-D-threo-hept-6-ulosonate synthase
MNGKRVRWNRFLHPDSGFGLIVPIDHGLTMGPIPGLRTIDELRSWLAHPGITGLIVHKGIAARLAEHKLTPRGGLMLHLTGMTTLGREPHTKQLVTSVDAALRYGADAVSLQVNFDGTNDVHNLKTLGSVVDDASRYGLPVLTMLYDVVPPDNAAARIVRLRHLMRAAVELGSDALKIAAPSDVLELGEIVDGFIDHTAIFVAGGAVRTEEEIATLADAVARCGATGLCVGRNVFQHPSPSTILDKLSARLHGHAPRRTFPMPVPIATRRVVGEG